MLILFVILGGNKVSTCSWYKLGRLIGGGLGKVNLKLYAIKKGNQNLDSCIRLVVVDLDKGKHYPLNFVCVLPRYLRLLEKRSSNFAKIFGGKSIHVAKNLLVAAKDQEENPEIQRVINRRIKDIESTT
jgi:hypothetical protein